MSESLLIVDDDAVIRRLVSMTLEGTGGFVLREAADGLEAIASARADPPAVVLLDVEMPVLDGISACRRLRELPGMHHCTIVMLTGSEDALIRAEASEAGADLFLTKPFSPLDLLQLVDRLGRRVSG